MFKQKLVIEVKGNSEKIYRFECETDSHLGEIHDVLCQMKNEIVKQICDHQKKDENKEESPSKCEDKNCEQEVKNEEPCTA